MTRGQWVTNDKRLLNLAGLEPIDQFVAQAAVDPGLLGEAVKRSLALCASALAQATPTAVPA